MCCGNNTLKVVARVCKFLAASPPTPCRCVHSSRAFYLAKSVKVSICGVRHCKGWAPQRDFGIERCKDTVGLGTAGIRYHGNCRNTAGGHCGNTVLLRAARIVLVTARMFRGWALQGYTAVEQRRDTLRLGTAMILGDWALQGDFAVEHCKNTSWLASAKMLAG